MKHLTFDIGYILKGIYKGIETRETFTIVQLFQDSEKYWIINEDCSWMILDREKPQEWVMLLHAEEYMAHLFALNGLVDEEWHIHVENEKCIEFTIETDKEIELY